MSTNPVVNNPPRNEPNNLGHEKGHTSVRVLGVFILLVELGLLFAYGFGGYIINEIGSWGGVNAVVGGLISMDLVYTGSGLIFYVVTLVFTLIAFGLLFAMNSRSTLTGFFLTFFVVGFTTILSPTLQKFWFDVFLDGFGSERTFNNSENSGLVDYAHYLSTTKIQISFYDMRISLLNAISQLVVFYGLFQRVNAAQVFLFSTIYQITWTLNFALNTQLAANQPDAAKRLMDDYGISQVFLFGSVFALVASLFVKKPPREDLALGVALPHLPITSPQVANNEIGLLASTLGTFLLFVCFMSITICFPVKSSRARYQWAEGYMNILFALCASVFTNMFVTHITKGKFGLREIHFGMIGGAIMAGPIAGTLDNPGAFMAIGTFAGLISALYYGFFHHKINRTRVYDTYGALFIFIVSFLGTFFIAPLVLIGMVRNEVTSVLLNNALITNGDVAGWSLVYVGISVGIAALSGLFIGLLLKCLEREVVREFDDENIFVPLPGLYDEAYVKSRIRVDDPYSQSASHLRGNAGI